MRWKIMKLASFNKDDTILKFEHHPAACCGVVPVAASCFGPNSRLYVTPRKKTALLKFAFTFCSKIIALQMKFAKLRSSKNKTDFRDNRL